MTGIHRVRISNVKVIFDFELRRNITVDHYRSAAFLFVAAIVMALWQLLHRDIRLLKSCVPPSESGTM